MLEGAQYKTVLGLEVPHGLLVSLLPWCTLYILRRHHDNTVMEDLGRCPVQRQDRNVSFGGKEGQAIPLPFAKKQDLLAAIPQSLDLGAVSYLRTRAEGASVATTSLRMVGDSIIPKSTSEGISNHHWKYLTARGGSPLVFVGCCSILLFSPHHFSVKIHSECHSMKAQLLTLLLIALPTGQPDTSAAASGDYTIAHYDLHYSPTGLALR